MRNALKSFGVGVTLAVMSLSVSAPAQARHDRHGGYYEAGYRDYYDNDDYYSNGRDYRRDRYYRGSRCSKGTGGTIIGAVAGGLLGREVVRRGGDRTAGAIIGAGAGALAGRALDKSSSSRRC